MTTHSLQNIMMTRYHSILAAITLLLVSTTSSAADDNLLPPDVDFYAGLQASYVDYGGIADDNANGMRLRGGVWLNELDLAGWRTGAEATINWMGTASRSRSFVRAPDGIESTAPNPPVSIAIKEQDRTSANGFEIGARFAKSERYYLRSGLLLYSTSHTNRQSRTLNFSDGSSADGGPLLESDRSSSVGAYLGAGARYRVAEGFYLVADYNAYATGEGRLGIFALGVQLEPPRY